MPSLLGLGWVSVYVLGRYRNDAQYVPIEFQRNFGDRMTIEFRTIHTSKGSEADYVILPGMVRKGFPNGKEDVRAKLFHVLVVVRPHLCRVAHARRLIGRWADDTAELVKRRRVGISPHKGG